jgi:hypothetical protein
MTDFSVQWLEDAHKTLTEQRAAAMERVLASVAVVAATPAVVVTLQ